MLYKETNPSGGHEHADTVGAWNWLGAVLKILCPLQGERARRCCWPRAEECRFIYSNGRIRITHRRRSRGPSRPCGPSYGGASSRQQRSAARSLQHHTRMLKGELEKWGFWCLLRENLRFSPVWLYMCVCKEEGRVKRLSQTLHLCFF